MKKIQFLSILLISISGFSQNDFLSKYVEAESFLNTNEIDSAYIKFKELEENVPKNDTLYDYALWYRTMTATHLQEVYRFEQKFDKSLFYALDALESINKGKERFDDEFAKREYFMVKNVIVAYYGLGNFAEGKRWKKKMYDAKKKGTLPEGIDEYFNYDFFKFENKNIWGYEWFEELPEDRFSKSFTKVIYYVYSTNPDGSDKDQLYRLHVLMFHNIDPSNGIDYVLTKRLETAKNEVSGTLYSYTYKEDIDFEKLKNDVKEVLKGNLEPETKNVVKRQKE